MIVLVEMFGFEMRFMLGRSEEETEVVHNTGGEFEVPFGFASRTAADDEEFDD